MTNALYRRCMSIDMAANGGIGPVDWRSAPPCALSSSQWKGSVTGDSLMNHEPPNPQLWRRRRRHGHASRGKGFHFSLQLDSLFVGCSFSHGLALRVLISLLDAGRLSLDLLSSTSSSFPSSTHHLLTTTNLSLHLPPLLLFPFISSFAPKPPYW